MGTATRTDRSARGESAASNGSGSTSPSGEGGRSRSSAMNGAPRRRNRSASPNDGNEKLSNFLGWFSIGLGVAQIVAPRGMARLVGASGDEDSQRAMRAIGLREITAGVGILSQPRAAGWLWARVAGDAMDVALLRKSTLGEDNPDRNRGLASTAAVLGVLALDVYAAQKLRGVEAGGFSVRESVTINRSPEEVYAFWRDFSNLPQFMRHLERVENIGTGRTRWRALTEGDSAVEWDVEVTDDRPNEMLSWRTVAGGSEKDNGTAYFRRAAGGRGTDVTVELSYDQMGGKVGAIVSKLFGEGPGLQRQGDLRRLKQLLETGEIVHSDSSIHRLPHSAQPPEEMPSRLENRFADSAQLVAERSAEATERSSNQARVETGAREEARF
jgi:uncharacterized membrane protein